MARQGHVDQGGGDRAGGGNRCALREGGPYIRTTHGTKKSSLSDYAQLLVYFSTELTTG